MQIINIKTIVEQEIEKQANAPKAENLITKTGIAFPTDKNSYEFDYYSAEKKAFMEYIAGSNEHVFSYSTIPSKAKKTVAYKDKGISENNASQTQKRAILGQVLYANEMHRQLDELYQIGSGRTIMVFPKPDDVRLFKGIVENTPLNRLNQLIYDPDLLFSAAPNIHTPPVKGISQLDRYGLYTMNMTEFFLRANFINVVSCHALSMNNRPGGNLGYQCSPYWFCIGAYQKPTGNRFHHPLNVVSDELYEEVEKVIGKVPPFIVALNVCVGFVQLNERQTAPALYVSRIYGDRRHVSFWKIIQALAEFLPNFAIIIREENFVDGMPYAPRLFRETTPQVLRFSTPPMYPLMTVMHNGKEYAPARHPDIVNTLTFENGMIAEELFGRVLIPGEAYNSVDFSAFNNDTRQKTKRVTFGRSINDVCDFCDKACDDNQLSENSRRVFMDGKLHVVQGMCVECMESLRWDDNTGMWVPEASLKSENSILLKDLKMTVCREYVQLHSAYIKPDGEILWTKAGFREYFAMQPQVYITRIIIDTLYVKCLELGKPKLKATKQRMAQRREPMAAQPAIAQVPQSHIQINEWVLEEAIRLSNNEDEDDI